LGKNHFEERLASTFICLSAWLALLPSRKWSNKFQTVVKEKGKEDPDYQQAWNRVEKEVVLGNPAPKG